MNGLPEVGSMWVDDDGVLVVTNVTYEVVDFYRFERNTELHAFLTHLSWAEWAKQAKCVWSPSPHKASGDVANQRCDKCGYNGADVVFVSDAAPTGEGDWLCLDCRIGIPRKKPQNHPAKTARVPCVCVRNQDGDYAIAGGKGRGCERRYTIQDAAIEERRAIGRDVPLTEQQIKDGWTVGQYRGIRFAIQPVPKRHVE